MSETITRVKSSQGNYDVHIGLKVMTKAFKGLLLDYPSSKFILVTDQTVNTLYSSEFNSLFNSKPSGVFEIFEVSTKSYVTNKGINEIADGPNLLSPIWEYRRLSNQQLDGEMGTCEWYKCVLPPGEASKTIGCMAAVMEVMSRCGLNRSDVLLAFGGGVVGDLAGYAASGYMRGISYVQIPTTLLAMIDSSIGGKVAVNLNGGKNLAGDFYSPIKVIAEISYLKTLNKRDYMSGMAEVIKYGFIQTPDILEGCRWSQPGNFLSDEVLESLMTQCVQAKARTVSEDEYESGLRMILNYGHTFGHSIEAVYNYERYTHGESVALGMIVMEYFTQWYYQNMDSESLKTTDAFADDFRVTEIIQRRKRLIDLLQHLGLPFELKVLNSLPMSDMKPYVFKDKKSTGDGIKLVMLESVGKAKVVEVPKSIVETFMDAWKSYLQMDDLL